MAVRIADEWPDRESVLGFSGQHEALIWESSLRADISAGSKLAWGQGGDVLLLRANAPAAGEGLALFAPGAEEGQRLGDAIGDNTSSSTSISVGSSLSSVIDSAGDLDYVRINLVAGQTYTFSLDGGSLIDAYLELRDASGVLIAQNDDGGIAYDSLLMFRPTSSGQYWVVARGYDSSQTGTYTLEVDTVDVGNSSPTTFADNGKPQFSWDEAAIQITRSGASWANAFHTSAVVTYSFRSTAPATMPDDTGGFSRFSAAQIAAAEATLAAWAAVANITFQRVDDGDGYSNNAAIVFGNYSSGASGAAAFAYLPTSGNTSAASVQGDVWVNVSLGYNANPVRGDYGYQVLLHEIGHAIGLDHPGDYNAGEGVTITYEAHAEYFNDSRMFTVMSYFASSNTGGVLPAYASLAQMHDIAAVQRLYGANLSTRTGNTIYGYNSNTGVPEYSLTLANQAAVFTIWDAGGLDTLDLSGYSSNSVIDLRQEAFSSVGGSVYNLSIARGAVIENAVGGSGNDTITGNAANNTLNGNAGADVLDGENGNDTLIGGAGADQLIGGAGTDTADYSNAGGGVTVRLSTGNGERGDALGDTYSSIENIIGSRFADSLTGTSGANSIAAGDGNDGLYGGVGNDVLDGGAGNDLLRGGAGADQLIGGAGTDTADYADASGGVTVRLSTGSGQRGDALGDTYSSIENIVGSRYADSLTGANGANSIVAGDGNDGLYGSGGDDLLDGGAGNDLLRGGTGADQLIGGAGTDTADYADASGGVTVRLTTGSGERGDALGDTYSSIENIVGSRYADSLTGTNGANSIVAGEGNDGLYGVAGADTLDGGAGNDKLDGGADSDSLTGGSGSDTFVFRAGQANGDIVVDFDGGGAGAGDVLQFQGYGSAAQGATLVQIDATHWQITSADGLTVDVITLSNGATLDPSDYIFIGG